MRERIQKIRSSLEQKKGEKARILKTIQKTKVEIKESGKELRKHEEAKEVLIQVALKTQARISYHVSDITSLGLETVFDNPYKLALDFVKRRNKTECDIFFEREEEKVDPISASGGGAVDVASFALRVASWSMEFPRSRNVLLLDEPFRYLSTDLIPKASELLKQISEKLKLQLIIVTHEEELLESADKVFKVSIKGGISKVEER